jgi:hypothetical protein
MGSVEGEGPVWQDILQWVRWFGTPSQIALLVIVLVTLIKTWPIIQKQLGDVMLAREGRYGARITHLESELKKCHEECTEKIDKLNNTIYGMRKQDFAKQHAIMRAIVRMSNDPDVKQQLVLLEAMEVSASREVTEINGVVGDKGDK